MDANTKVTLTMKQLLTGIVAVMVTAGGVLWAVMSFTIGGMPDDVRGIRQSIENLQTSDKEAAVRLRETEIKLGDQIGGLRTDLASLRGTLDNVSSSVKNLDSRLVDFQKQIAATQAAYLDPKNIAAFAEQLKKSGLED